MGPTVRGNDLSRDEGAALIYRIFRVASSILIAASIVGAVFVPEARPGARELLVPVLIGAVLALVIGVVSVRWVSLDKRRRALTALNPRVARRFGIAPEDEQPKDR